MIQFSITLINFPSLFVMIMFRNSIQHGTKFYYVKEIPSDDILESLYKLRIQESEQLKTVLELYDLEINQKISMPNYQRLKAMVKRSFDQQLRLRKFDARHEKIETGAVEKSHGELSGVERGKRYLLPVERKRAVFEGRPMQFPA